MRIFKAILKFNKDNEVYDAENLEYMDLSEASHTFKKLVHTKEINVPANKRLTSMHDVTFMDGERYKFVLGRDNLRGFKCTKEFFQEFMLMY